MLVPNNNITFSFTGKERDSETGFGYFGARYYASSLPVQHLQYLPFGEHFVNEQSSGYFERFTFTGKERDAETGFYYHGARFNSSDLGWLSVDPLADKYPSMSPYAYCAWNPIKLVDKEGRECADYYDVFGKYIGSDGLNDDRNFWVRNQNEVKLVKRNHKKGLPTSLSELPKAQELPNKQNINAMMKVVEYDRVNNLREYGGNILLNPDGSQLLYEYCPGPIWDRISDPEIALEPCNDGPKPELDSKAIVLATYHSHMSETYLNGEWVSHDPSVFDYSNAKEGVLNFVFGLYGKPEVTIYDKAGIIVTMPLSTFQKMGK